MSFSCIPPTVSHDHSPWISCPTKYGLPHKIIPNLSTSIQFGGVKYEARNVLPTPPVTYSPPPFFPVPISSTPICGCPGDLLPPVTLCALKPNCNVIRNTQ